MNSKTRIAKDMLSIARELMAGDYADKTTYERITKNPTNMSDFKKLRSVFQNPQPKKADEKEAGDLSDNAMDMVAKELLAVAKELMNDGD